MNRFLMIVIILVCVAGAANALDPERPFDYYLKPNWGSEDGLPQNSAMTILQTKDGYLWLGTHDGGSRKVY